MIATVTLNPSLDKTIQVDRLELDDAVRADAVRFDPGGKGLNVSRVFWELGQPSLVLGFLGGNTGQQVLKFLEDEGLKCDFNWVMGETRTNIIIEVKGLQGQYRISTPGAPVTTDELHRLKRKMAARTTEYETLVLSGSIPPGLPKCTYRELMVEAHLRGDRVVLDADGEAFREGLKERPFMVKPNLHELQRHVGRPLTDRNAILGAIGELLEAGVELVVVSAGAGEVLAASREGRWRVVPPPVEAHTTLGAGDSMIAGILFHLHQLSTDHGDAVRYGVACGAACAMTKGTELAHLRDVRHLLPKVQIEEV